MSGNHVSFFTMRFLHCLTLPFPYRRTTMFIQIHSKLQAGGNTVQWLDTHPGLLRCDVQR